MSSSFQTLPDEESQSLIPKKSDRFAPSSYKDLWALILFVIFFIGFIAISAFSLHGLSLYKTINIQDENLMKTPQVGHVIGVLLTTISVGFALSFGYFMAMKRFAGKMITTSLYASIAVQFLMAILCLVAYLKYPQQIGYAIGAVVFLLLGILWIWAFQYWKTRIPFARVMLKTVTGVITQYPATLTVGVVALLVQAVFSTWWILTLAGFAQMVVSKSISDGLAIFIGLYLVFMFYWTSEVIKNVVHITIAGVFGTFYFLGVADPSGRVDVPVKNPTVQAAKRALTTSLGPNCYGSLLIAIIQLVRFIVNTARQSAQDADNIACVVCLCCVECFVAMIESLLEYFNKYAFTQVAIYGKDFCSAGRDTWELIKSRGIDLIIVDDLIGNVLAIGAFVIGLVNAAGGALFVLLSTMPKTSTYYMVVAVIGFLVGIAEFSILSVVIDSGVATTFVCIAEDSLAIAQKQPELYHQIQQTYPAVVFF